MVSALVVNQVRDKFQRIRLFQSKKMAKWFCRKLEEYICFVKDLEKLKDAKR